MSDRSEAVRRMLEPRTVAVVGASTKPGSFGDRMAREALRSTSAPRVHLVHPRYDTVLDLPCVPSLADVPGPLDLVMLGVPDAALPEQVGLAADRGDGGAVVFGSAHGVAEQVAARAREGGLALCGVACMGFVNVARGIRAVGYVERSVLTPGPIALVTHSGSAFSSLLRTHRRLDYSLAVSSGRELVTTTADYLGYALDQPETKVIGLFLETMRDVPALRGALARASEGDVPVVALAVGSSPMGRSMVGAHSGALAGDDAAWEALFGAYGVHRVQDLDELVDTLELFAIGRRVRRTGRTSRVGGIATVHDSGGERVLTADMAHRSGVPFAELGEPTAARLAGVLEPGLLATNPLDVWGTGARTEELFTDALRALVADDAVEVAALAVDLVEEYDGDVSYPRAVLRVHAETDKPVVVLSTLGMAVDQEVAGELRAAGVPVLEGITSGMRSLRHLLDAATPARLPAAAHVDVQRRDRWLPRLAGLSDHELFDLLADYGIEVARPHPAWSTGAVLEAASRTGYPVVLKTAGVAHKVDVGGVVVGLTGPAELAAAYAEMAGRLGPRVLVQPMVEGGVELALGLVADPHLGTLVLLAAGGTLVELVGQRAVALPPLDPERADALVDAVPLVRDLLAGARGAAPADRTAVVRALVGLGRLAVELGQGLAALDVNPLVCTADGAVAVDVLLLTPEG